MFVPILLALLLAGAQASAQPAAPPPLTLKEAVAQARRASPSREGAAAMATGAELAYRLSGRLLNPLVDVRAENFGARAVDPAGLPLDVFAVITQPFEWPGKRGERRAVAAADRDLAAAVLLVVERQLALETARTYMRALRAREFAASILENRAGLTATIDTLRRRVGEGLTAEADLLRFQTEGAKLDTELARTRLELARDLAELAALVGSRVPIDAAALVEPAPIDAERATPDEAIAAAIEQRPDVRLARARHDRADRAARLEHLRLMPDPAITGGLKRTATYNTGVLGVTFAVPLFDRNGQATARADADVRAASLDLDAIRLRAIAESRALTLASTTLAEQAGRADAELLQPAAIVRDAARAMFREGAADILKLVDAERIYADVRREALALRLEAYLACIEARFAVGLEDIP